eukprot:CAMPEP_0178595226 /NCGR_PEP_ID=MMETSP0697-20121206/30942_1 /TAXON_ID=265572 /ORGANISM="Extubocellulus spinifer, Strain CCMP396" /LENGTH=364 /DNA_ID=CAMNT_0020232605 /DNA_START=270 /DNA_END=1364 /DNA_ORIENTATION=-
MPSLTPHHRAEETAEHAFRDGVVSGVLAMVPSSVALYLAMQNKTFVRSTNWQSRTALVLTPPLFMFGLSSESKLQQRMQQMAHDAEHSRSTAEWAHEQERKVREEERERIARSDSLRRMDTSTVTTPLSAAAVDDMTSDEVERQITELYNQSVQNSGVRIVPGDRLGPHHILANYWQENPFKILAGIGVPTVLYIYKGRDTKQHLQLQSKLMHTRIFGQFAVIGMLLSLMGFKSYMDEAGTYITEAEANARVDDMRRMRLQLKERIARDKVQMDQRNRVLRGKAENNDEHRQRSAVLENVDDFEAQLEQVEKKETKKRKKKKKRKMAKEIEKGVVIIVDEEDEEDDDVVVAIDPKEADKIASSQ